MPPVTELDCLRPDWPAPDNVCALATTRLGGCSAAPWNSLNLGHHVGDDAAAVAANRQRLQDALPPGSRLCWLDQIHGDQVVRAIPGEQPSADALISSTPGNACAILTADCLPVLFCSRRGDVVAAAHAGWRGLAAGVLENTLRAMRCPPGEVMAWLGPAIGPTAFEVGPEVRSIFLENLSGAVASAADACFTRSEGRPGHYFADLAALARLRLREAGVDQTYGGDYCTYTDQARFYSYRRDGRTGRMATVIVIR